MMERALLLVILGSMLVAGAMSMHVAKDLLTLLAWG